MGDTSDPAEPPGQTTALLAVIRTSRSSSRRPLRSILASWGILQLYCRSEPTLFLTHSCDLVVGHAMMCSPVGSGGLRQCPRSEKPGGPAGCRCVRGLDPTRVLALWCALAWLWPAVWGGICSPPAAFLPRGCSALWALPSGLHAATLLQQTLQLQLG